MVQRRVAVCADSFDLALAATADMAPHPIVLAAAPLAALVTGRRLRMTVQATMAESR